MSRDHHHHKRRKTPEDYDDAPKKSLVDYSRVSGRPAEAVGRRSESKGGPSGPIGAAAAAAIPAKMSAQMEAVVRLMAGVEERTIAQKLADSNRPSWDDYKKANEDKLNLEGVDHKKMEEYRRELDAEREKRLSRGLNHGGSKKKKKRKKSSSSDDDSSSEGDSEDDRRSKKKHKRKHKKERKRRKHKRKEEEGDSGDSDSERRRKKKKKKKSSKKEDNNHSGEESDGSHYRLSKFFTDDNE